MAYEFSFLGLANLIKDMRRHDQDIDEFSFEYNKVHFRAILDIGTTPFQLLLGTGRRTDQTDRLCVNADKSLIREKREC